MRKELWVRERLPALLLQTRHREALLPDRSLLPTAMCVSETELLQPLLRSSQVLCSGRLLCSGSVLCAQVLRSTQVLCSGSGVLPGSDLRLSRKVLRSSEVLPGSGLVLCSVDLCAEVLLPGSGELLRSGRSWLQHLQFVQQLQQRLVARLARHVPSQQGRLLPDLVHDDEGLLCRSLRSC